MYLKSVEVVGFKSFADKTKLDFKPGITAIIGPNGCGKSNIHECIRWCIGEMSWKSLRSTAMVDVIFAGTARRAPLNMAEVTLTFDNSTGQLAMPYSEIMVSRRLFRSGESEYYLNKTQCRLRDVRELFLDTGLGGDGYAIIDQGGVDFVIKAKPEDRRSLFEEAAGVSKYKAKREEALRKLERVDADLARLADSMALINEQIRKLDSDARKARLYKKYQEELTGLEVAQTLADVAAAQAELDAEAARIAPVREAFDALTNELHAEEGRDAALQLERAQGQARWAEANQALSEIKGRLERLDERLSHNKESADQLLRRDEQDQQYIKGDEERLAALEPLLTQAQAAADDAAGREAEAKLALDEFEAAVAGLDQEVLKAAEELDALKHTTVEASGKAAEAATAVDAAESSVGHMEERTRQALRDAAREGARAVAERAELDAQLAHLAEARLCCEGAEKAAAELEEAGAATAARRAIVDGELALVHDEMVRLRAKVENLEAQGSRDPYWAGAHAITSAGLPGVLGTVRSLIQVEESYARMVEDVLGERLFAVVCEDPAAAHGALEFLKGTGKGRARILVLSAVPQASGQQGYPPDARPLIDRVHVEPRFQEALRLLIGEAYALGGAVYGPHWVYGGSMPAEGEGLNLFEFQALETKVADQTAKEESLAAERTRLEQEAAAQATDLAQAREEKHEQALRVREADALRVDREKRLAVIDTNIRTCEGEGQALLCEMGVLREALAEARAGLEAARQGDDAAKLKEREAAERLEGLKERARQRQVRRSELQGQLTTAAANQKVTQNQFSTLAMEKEQKDVSRAKLQADRDEIARQLVALAAAADQARADQEQLAAKRGESEVRVSALAAQVAQMDQSLNALAEKIRGLRQQSGEKGEEVQKYEVRVSAVRAGQDAAKKRIWDEWQLPFEEAAAKYAGVAADAERLESLRKRIQNMGPINQGAPEEYEALTQKHGFLTAQVQDLTKAKDDLRAAINKINSTTRENFRQTFTDVREHFRRIYGSLFEGGEADLVLTAPDNVLETGIEIVAQPPGKRLQSISLLSGGEKTLTAIALLFAFFMVRPSPLCMLDEADAALDEANTDRFAHMIKEFAQKTQFIVVSHSKRTIEAAEQIYGVTMEEGGVTQMISVDFRRRGEGTVQPVLDASAPKAPEMSEKAGS